MKRVAILWILLMSMVCMGFVTQARADEPKQAPPAAQPMPPPPDWFLVKDPKIAADLQSISVTLKSERSQGSGTLIVKGSKVFVLTAEHVVRGNRHTREVIDSKTGGKRTVVEFDPIKVVTEIRKNGRRVGSQEFDANVITCSDADYGEDLALLVIEAENFAKQGAMFFHGTKEQPYTVVGTDVFHCGSLNGEFGHNSVIKGSVSQVGRVYEKKLYDQLDINAFPGSSGGGVYLRGDGRYVGMIVRGLQGGFMLMVPQRRIDTWAKRMKVDWALDASKPVPSDEEMAKIPIEDVAGGVGTSRDGKQLLSIVDRNGFLLWIPVEKTPPPPQNLPRINPQSK